MNILLGLTGSVATTLAPKIIEALRSEFNAEIKVVMTKPAEHFYDAFNLSQELKVSVYTEEDEWTWENRSIYVKGDPVLHIELREWADILVLAPLTLNTMAKMVNGICDNLLTSIYRAWDVNKLVVFAPCANTFMWENLITEKHVKELRYKYNHMYVPPISKLLACGDYGMGALAEIKDIVKAVEDSLQWWFPIRDNSCTGIPVGKHPGAFGAKRKYDRHCGVDLYCEERTNIFAMESGKVVLIEQFTGEKVGTPWWNDTWALKIEGWSGVICYGEIQPTKKLKVGDFVKKGEYLGQVIPVLPKEKLREDITGHRTSMLHVQLYSKGKYHKDHTWKLEEENPPEGVQDPTKKLIQSIGQSIGGKCLPILEM